MHRLLAYGYRFWEYDLPLSEIKNDAMVDIHHLTSDSIRPPVMVSLGCHLEGFAPPHPDFHDQKSVIAGAFKRFMTKVPDPNRELLSEFRQFCRCWCEKHLVPLSQDSDLTVSAWLRDTGYPEWRRQELQEIWDQSEGLFRPRHRRVNSFVKDETYGMVAKHCRVINSRHDLFKCLVGPIFKLIEKQLFSLPYFIKKVPVADRPKYIFDLLYSEGAEYVATDYTSYESHFTREVMESCEFVLYDYMTKNLPFFREGNLAGKSFMDIVSSVLGGKNYCCFKTFTLVLEATRMSGEMCTSLGNSFSNLMALLFLCEKKGATAMAVVEGDDCLGRVIGDCPTTEDFAELGFTIKMEKHTKLEEASFCGLIFDLEDLVNVTDPREVLLNFGWAGTPYVQCKDIRLMELLRAKALSYAHQYPGCPIIQSLAFYGLRITKHISLTRFIEKSRSLSMWEREQLMLAISEQKTIKPREVPINTRHLVAEKFGLSIQDQLEIESYLDGLTKLEPLHHWSFDFVMHKDSVQYWHYYVRSHGHTYRPDLGLNRYEGQLRKYDGHIRWPSGEYYLEL